MPKQTLLDMTQLIMSDMVAGRINSIGDTEESLAVADIIKRTYFDLLADHNLPTRRGLISLTALAVPATPTTFKIPDAVSEIEWIRYDSRIDTSDTQVRYVDLSYLDPESFFNRSSMYNSADGNIDVVVATGDIKLLIRNDENPRYWTSFDNKYVIMDGYDKTIESTLQQSKVAAFGTSSASWTTTDTFVPDLPEHLFPLLLSTAENRAFEFIKQTMSMNVDKQERRSRRRYDAHKNRTDKSRPSANYGR